MTKGIVMKKTILVLAGDGIGSEVMAQALRVLSTIKARFGLEYDLVQGEIGGAAYRLYGSHFPEQTRKLCEGVDTILFGSVGGPLNEAHLKQWIDCEKNSILALRKCFNLNVNLRPVRIYPSLQAASPLKEEVIADGVDIVFVRELLGDIYFGEHKQYVNNNLRCAHDVAQYDEEKIQQVARAAFSIAQKRRRQVVSVDKANVLDTSKLWRTVVSEVAKEFPDVTLEHMLVDNCAMQLVINPSQFDVIVTSNLFGDILSDEGAALAGSLGLIPSASLNQAGVGLYEPAGGSAPDLAGKNSANPIAQILSVSMMLRYSFVHEAAACAIEDAVEKTIESFCTKDILTAGKQLVGTKALTDEIVKYLNH